MASEVAKSRPIAARKRGTPEGGSPHPGSLVGAGVAEVPDHIVIDGPGHRAPQYVTAKANLLEGVLGLLLLLWRVGLPLVWVPFEALAAVSLFHVRRRGVAAHPQDVVGTFSRADELLHLVVGHRLRRTCLRHGFGTRRVASNYE